MSIMISMLIGFEIVRYFLSDYLSFLNVYLNKILSPNIKELKY